jgi:diguanylate cyclase (GGDEF)-like protein
MLPEIGGTYVKSENMIDKRFLVRDILNILWVIIGLYIVGTSINFFFTSEDEEVFLKVVILYPSIKLIGVMILIELCFRKVRKYIEYFAIIGISIIVSIIVITLYEKTVAVFLLVFPILVSLFFYNRKLLKFAVGIGFLSFFLIYFLSEQVRSNMRTSDFIIMISILVGVSLLINSLIKHSHQVMNELLKTTKEKHDLFSQNVHMERLTRIDPVTELYNHRSFHEHLDSIIEINSAEEFDVHVAVLDIDNFKQINDTFGHRAGDSVIIEVAKQIQHYVGGDDFPSRYGGEEFAIISIGASDDNFIKKVEAIRTSIANTNFYELNGRKVTISVGVQKKLPGMSKELLFNAADSALYTAKRTGKNKTVLNRT